MERFLEDNLNLWYWSYEKKFLGYFLVQVIQIAQKVFIFIVVL